MKIRIWKLLITVNDDLLDSLIRDLLPLRKSFPSYRYPLCPVQIILLNDFQLFRTEVVLVFVFFLHLFYLIHGPNFLMVFNPLKYDLGWEGILVDGAVEFFAKPSAGSTSFSFLFIIISIKCLELAHDKKLIVGKSLIARPHVSFTLLASFDFPLFIGISMVKLDHTREVQYVLRV